MINVWLNYLLIWFWLQRKVQHFQNSFPKVHEIVAISCSNDSVRQLFGKLFKTSWSPNVPQLLSYTMFKILVVSVASSSSLCKSARNGEWNKLFYCSIFISSLQCMLTTWYLSVDWQMTVFVAPILIYMLWKFGKSILKFIVLMIIISCLYGFKICLQNKFVAQELNM